MSVTVTRPATRTESEVAADAVMLLMTEGIIQRRPEVLARVSRVLGLTMQELREADIRRTKGYARPPETRMCLDAPISKLAPAENIFRGEVGRMHAPKPPQPNVVTPVPETKDFVWTTRTTAGAVETRFPTTTESPSSGATAASPTSPPPTTCGTRPSLPSTASPAPTKSDETPDRLICSRCAKLRLNREFRAGSTVCKLCIWRKTRRTRYLIDVGSAVLDSHDELVGSACGVCGEPFRVGDWIKPVDVLLAHGRCAE